MVASKAGSPPDYQQDRALYALCRRERLLDAPGAISPEEFASLEKSRNNVVFIDVRTGEEAATGVLKDAQHIPLDKLADATSSLPKDKEIILYCANGIRAQMGYELLSKQGFKTRYLNENITVDKSGNYKM